MTIYDTLTNVAEQGEYFTREGQPTLDDYRRAC